MAIAKVIYKSDANDSGTVWIDTTQKTVTSGTMLSGQTALKNDGTDITGNIATKTSADMTVSGATVTAPAGYYATGASKSVASGSATTPATTITPNDISISVNTSTGLITASNTQKTQSVTPTVSAGYVSSGTAGTITVSAKSKTSQLSTVNGSTITPTESEQTAVAANKYTLGAVKVGAISSTYVGSGITQRTSTDLSASGATVTVPAGYYASQATKSVSSGTAGTPTATKGTVSNHSVSVTPSVTNTAGYISGGTKTGTAVTVSASELVSGSQEVTENGTVDVTNLAEVVVNVASTPESIVPDSAFADYKTHIGYYFDSDSGTPAYTAYIGVKPSSATGTTIDWGDGTTTTTDTTDYKIYSHTYSTAPSDGYYMWTLTAASGTSYRLDGGSSGYETQYRAYGDSTDPIYMANSSRIRWVTLGVGYNFGTITYSVFQECAGLEEVFFQHSSTQYGFTMTRYSMFKNAPKLRNVVPKTPNRFNSLSLYQYSFEGCGSLTSLDVSSITIAGTRTFQAYAFKNCVNLKEFKTATVSSTFSYAEGLFQNCYSLKRMDITSTGTVNIAALAFNNCASLSEIHFHSTTPPTVANINAWTGVPTTCKIYVPTGYLNAYKSATNMPDPTSYTYIEE